MSNRKKVIIIGAGPGGLATALQLAHAGVEVVVLESRAAVGGRCSAIQEQGFRFDVGPTFFLYPRVLREIFASVGKDLERECPMKKLDPQYRVSFGAGGQLDCTPDLANMERQIGLLSPSDAGALKHYMDDNRVKLARFRPILESPFNSALDLLRPSLLGAASLVKPWRSLGAELECYFRDPRLVVAFSFQAKYLGMSPFRCPSLFSILSFLEYEHGVFHPVGGCSQVCHRMAEIAQGMGVRIHLNEPVQGLELRGRRVVGVHTQHASYHSDAIVINADFAATMRRLVPDRLRRRWSDARLAKKRFSCSTFMLYLGIEGNVDQPHHHIHISRDYQRNLRQIEQEGVLPDDPSIYVQNPCITDPALAPEGHSALYVLVPVPNLQKRKVAWDQATAESYRSLVLRRLQALGYGDLHQRIRFERMLTPTDWRESFDVHEGATFNLAHNLGQMLHRRPHNKFEELDGVYLVGGGTHPGSGLPVIFESTRITCKQLLPALGISPAFIEVAPTSAATPELSSGIA
jgi:phytoene desaturase